MAQARRAVIDVGTNSVKILVGDVQAGVVAPVLETSSQTRLGKGLYEDNLLHPDAIAETAAAVGQFADEARRLGASHVRVIATSAVREAANSRDLRQAILAGCGLQMRIITGDQEADLAYRGAATDPSLSNKRMLLLDMGGGSTEMILGCDGQAQFRHSFPIGTLRIMAQVPIGDNPGPEVLLQCRQWLRDYIRREVKPRLEPELKSSAASSAGQSTLLVGTGGTSTILGRMEAQINDYDRDTIESARISAARMRWHTTRLWSLPLSERRKVTGLPPNRADVILPGAATYEAIMDELGFNELRVSTRGLRFAALLA